MTAPQRKVISPWQKQYYAIDVYFFKKRATKNYITPTDTFKYMFLRSGLACIWTTFWLEYPEHFVCYQCHLKSLERLGYCSVQSLLFCPPLKASLYCSWIPSKENEIL